MTSQAPRIEPHHIRSEVSSVVVGDALAVLRDLATDSFDAVVTDPPYSIGLTRNDSSRGRHWDNSRIAFDREFWSEVGRVVRPGGNVVAFGHSRTFARMSVAMEDSGLTVVDTLAWIHGQGYAAGYRGLESELERIERKDLASTYAGWGNMLRPAFEPIALMRNLKRGDSLPEAIASGGTGGLNTDATHIEAGTENRSRPPGRVAPTAVWRIERPGRVKSAPPPGRRPSNVLVQHEPNCSVNTGCTPTCPAQIIREQGLATRGRNQDARRFYQGFLHHPKAPASERPIVNGVSAASVKPLGVMDWIVALTCQPGQLILDPFAGTGTTLLACARAGVRSLGIEAEEAYLPLIQAKVSADVA